MHPTSSGPEAEIAGTVEPSGSEWFGHPRGLSTLFFTEMWERFSYYGMRALLVLFMTDMVTSGGLGMTDVTATAIYGLYTFAVYAVALPGGWIADRLTGQRQAVLWGGIVIAAGHFTLAIPTLTGFYAGLILIVLGTGLLKPNVSAIVADLYPEGGARRDAGFSVFYMGINVGALAGPLICGYLGENIDWHLGFSAAGVGMALGVTQYVLGWRHLGDAGSLRAGPADRAKAWRMFVKGVGVTVAMLLALVVGQSAGWLTFSFLGVAQGTGLIITIRRDSVFCLRLHARRIEPGRTEARGGHSDLVSCRGRLLVWVRAGWVVHESLCRAPDRSDDVRMGGASKLAAVDQPAVHHRVRAGCGRAVGEAGFEKPVDSRQVFLRPAAARPWLLRAGLGVDVHD